MSTRSNVLMYLLVLLISLTVAPNVQAQTTTITNLHYPTQAVLQNGVAQATVTFTIGFSDLPSGNVLVLGILYEGTSNFVTGSATSTPDSCTPLTGTRYANHAACLVTPTSSSGTESISSVLTFNSTQQYNLRAFVDMVDKSNNAISGSVSRQTFTITVTAQVQSTVQTVTPESSVAYRIDYFIGHHSLEIGLGIIGILVIGLIIHRKRRRTSPVILPQYSQSLSSAQLQSPKEQGVQHCINCGHAIRLNLQFCTSCGRPLPRSSPLLSGTQIVRMMSSSQVLSPLVPEIVALIGGIISTILVALPLSSLFREPGILVGAVEEPAKLVGVILLALKYPKNISSKTRGLILGGLAGLGFGFAENFWYFVRAGTTYQCLYRVGGQCVSMVPVQMGATGIILRTILSVPGHMIFSGIAALGLVYLAKKNIDLPNRTRGTIASWFMSKDVFPFFLLAIILHGLWDALTAGPLIMFFVTLFVFYRVRKILPENLQAYPAPGYGLFVKIFVPHKRQTHEPILRAAQPQMTRCKSCGQQILTSRFCEFCGSAQ